VDNEQELNMYLQSIGKYVTAIHLVQYMAHDNVKTCWKLKWDGISHVMAVWWMGKLSYRWTFQPSSQFVDGHEREDIVNYRQNVFLPAMVEYDAKIRRYNNDGTEEVGPWPHDVEDGLRPYQDQTVLWFHNESTFYANDRWKVGWIHRDVTAVPQPKGEGTSLMVADFISADYGWLHSKDLSHVARVLFKAGAGREGYFTSDNVCAQVRIAMDICDIEYSGEKHVFIFDNATTHLKQVDDALSVRNMPKNPSSNFGVEQNKLGANKKQIYGPDRKPVKEKVNMANGTFHDGSPQDFYFSEGHPEAGHFKGMAIILEECGYLGCTGLKGKWAECPKFKCTPGAIECCCH
jgi:hypothetical protein